MATLESAMELMEKLRASSYAPAEKELKDLQEFAAKQGFSEELKPWDVTFYAERQLVCCAERSAATGDAVRSTRTGVAAIGLCCVCVVWKCKHPGAEGCSAGTAVSAHVGYAPSCDGHAST
eukprot:2466011-Rhodomonas_salina.1